MHLINRVIVPVKVSSKQAIININSLYKTHYKQFKMQKFTLIYSLE